MIVYLHCLSPHSILNKFHSFTIPASTCTLGFGGLLEPIPNCPTVIVSRQSDTLDKSVLSDKTAESFFFIITLEHLIQESQWHVRSLSSGQEAEVPVGSEDPAEWNGESRWWNSGEWHWTKHGRTPEWVTLRNKPEECLCFSIWCAQ